MVQPDSTKVGGLSEARRIGWLADAYSVRLIPHGWNTAIGLAADLQLASALPATDLVEYMADAVFIDGIVAEPFKLDADGMLAIPVTAGLGVELDFEALARYADVSRATEPHTMTCSLTNSRIGGSNGTFSERKKPPARPAVSHRRER